MCRLGNGDMRQTLNILQSTFMAAGEVSEAAAYACTGNPLPDQVRAILEWLLNDPMATAYDKLTRIQARALGEVACARVACLASVWAVP